MEKIDRDQREGWIKDLEVGDQVFIISREGRQLAEISKITPTGRLIIAGITFTPDGFNRVNTWNQIHITMATDEAIGRFMARKEKRKLWEEAQELMKNVDPTSLTLDQVKSIVSILKEGSYYVSK